MLSALLDIVIPVFAVAGLGALYGRLRGEPNSVTSTGPT